MFLDFPIALYPWYKSLSHSAADIIIIFIISTTDDYSSRRTQSPTALEW